MSYHVNRKAEKRKKTSRRCWKQYCRCYTAGSKNWSGQSSNNC